jgi:hypothetical protein
MSNKFGDTEIAAHGPEHSQPDAAGPLNPPQNRKTWTSTEEDAPSAGRAKGLADKGILSGINLVEAGGTLISL